MRIKLSTINKNNNERKKNTETRENHFGTACIVYTTTWCRCIEFVFPTSWL